MTQKKTCLPVNAAYNTKMYSLTGRDQNGTSLTLLQQLETRNFIPKENGSSHHEDKSAVKDNEYQDLNSPIENLIKV